jgi:hypothetical protein
MQFLHKEEKKHETIAAKMAVRWLQEKDFLRSLWVQIQTS